MAKNAADCLTLELPGLPAARGRPRSPNPLTGAQRTARWRAKQKQERLVSSLKFHELSDVDLARYSVWDTVKPADARACWIELGRRKGWRK